MKIIPEKILVELGKFVNDYCKSSRRHFWGTVMPQTFFDDILLVTLFKDVEGIGFDALEHALAFDYKLGHHSLQHNVYFVREALREWAMTKIRFGTLEEWKQEAKKAGLPSLVCDANMWIDSSDFPVKGKNSVKKTSDKWSYKLNRPGHRFMFAVSASTRVRRVWGGYSPKMYDGEFLSSHKEEIESDFCGSTFIGDNHFSRGKKLFKNVKFLVNTPKLAKNKIPVDENPTAASVMERIVEEDAREVISKEVEKFNNQHQAARARIEQPFGHMKAKFSCLEKPWNEPLVQLDYVVRFAAAIHNTVVVDSN